MKDLFGHRDIGGKPKKESAFIVFRKFYGFDKEHKCVSCKVEVCPGRGDTLDRACQKWEEKNGRKTDRDVNESNQKGM